MKLVFASTNAGKLSEIRAILSPDTELLTPADIGFFKEIEETGKTFYENAEIKARTIFEACSLPSFADDSGLEVKALKDAPGVRSARFAGEKADTEANNALLLEKLKGVKDRSARFVTVICLIVGNKTLFFEGEVKGKIAEQASGSNGFGYDPLFIPEGYTQTFAEMEANEKNAISHRKMALNKMKEFLIFL